MEELRLRPFLPRQELHIVNEQHVHAAIPLAKVEDPVVSHRVDHLVHESFGRDVRQLQMVQVREHVVPDCMHQVRLPEPHAPVDEQRVVRARGGFRHGARGGMRELIRRTDDERVEGIAGCEAGRAGVVFLVGRPHRVGHRQLLGDWRQGRFHPLGGIFGEELDPTAGTFYLQQRLVENRRVVLRQPVAKQRIGHADAHDSDPLRDEAGRPEPGVEAVTVDLGFDSGKDRVPNVGSRHGVPAAP